MPSLLQCFSCLGLGSLHSWRRRNQHPTRLHLTVAMHHLLTGTIHYALLIPNTSYSNSGFHPISYTRTILIRILCPQIPNSAERRVLRFDAVANFKYFCWVSHLAWNTLFGSIQGTSIQTMSSYVNSICTYFSNRPCIIVFWRLKFSPKKTFLLSSSQEAEANAVVVQWKSSTILCHRPECR